MNTSLLNCFTCLESEGTEQRPPPAGTQGAHLSPEPKEGACGTTADEIPGKLPVVKIYGECLGRAYDVSVGSKSLFCLLTSFHGTKPQSTY